MSVQNINGYVLILRAVGELGILFGESRIPRQKYQSLRTNGLTPYKTIETLELGKLELISREKCLVELARLELVVAESEDELSRLNPPYIIIENWSKRDEESVTLGLIGKQVENKPSFDGRALLEQNGFLGYDSLRDVKYRAGEILRQSGGRVSSAIAQFKFELLT